MFTQIAREEDEHYKMLEKIHKKLENSGVWPGDVSAVVGDTDLWAAIKDFPSLAYKTYSSNADDVEAIKISINFEKEAYKFYTELGEKAESGEERTFFTHLAQIEWGHAQSLEESLAFFDDPESWNLGKEKSQLDG